MGLAGRPLPAALLALGLTAALAAAGVASSHSPVPAAAPATLPAASPGPSAVPSPTSGPEADEPLFTFVSVPDFINADIGDTRQRAGLGWDRGDPNSVNASWDEAIDVVLDEVQAARPDVVLVAGDLVGGHWGIDDLGTGIFGPTGTEGERLRAISNAGDLYYGEWERRFAKRGLRVLPAVGDHEIGDNPWPAGEFKQRAVPEFKQVWARHFTRGPGGGHRYESRPVGTPYEDTAYAVRIQNTLFVTVDEFKQTASGVRMTVDGGQLRWLDEVLGAARADGVEHIVVQGHVPVLGPVRHRHSSNLKLEDGADSPFWRTLQRHDVDLYLSGEVHDMTTLTDGPVQVSHGALASWGDVNFLRGRVYADRIELDLQVVDGEVTDYRRMWQTGGTGRPHRGVRFERGTVTVGNLTIDKSAGAPLLEGRTGLLLDAVGLSRAGS